MSGKAPASGDLPDFAVDALLRICWGSLLILPYELRVAASGRITSGLVAPVARYRRRALDNLAFAMPELSAEERERICKGCLDNFGRLFAETSSPGAFMARAARWKPEGDGMEAIEAAAQEGRPLVLVGGHFGNYEAARAVLIRRGLMVGGLYRPMNNRFFNRRYVRQMERIGEPVYPKSVSGTKQLVRYLDSGGIAVILNDQHAGEGMATPFLGRPAKTSLAPAKFALKYEAPLIPFFAARRGGGLDFDVHFERPIPAADPETMTLAFNERLEKRVRKHPEQWFWIHRRWK